MRPALAQETVEVADLLAAGAEADGRTVTVEGELIGDYGRRGEDVWVQLNDDPYVGEPLLEGGDPAGGNTGIALRLPEALINDLDPPGGYRRRGPILRVTGVWRHHDPGRGGESYLDVTGADLVEPGREMSHDQNWVSILLGAALLGGAAIAIAGRRRDLDA